MAPTHRASGVAVPGRAHRPADRGHRRRTARQRSSAIDCRRPGYAKARSAAGARLCRRAKRSLRRSRNFAETSRCRRASRRRIDCQVRWVDIDNTKYCGGYVAVVIERDGQANLGERRGCRFKPHSRLSNPTPATFTDRPHRRRRQSCAAGLRHKRHYAGSGSDSRSKTDDGPSVATAPARTPHVRGSVPDVGLRRPRPHLGPRSRPRSGISSRQRRTACTRASALPPRGPLTCL